MARWQGRAAVLAVAFLTLAWATGPVWGGEPVAPGFPKVPAPRSSPTATQSTRFAAASRSSATATQLTALPAATGVALPAVVGGAPNPGPTPARELPLAGPTADALIDQAAGASQISASTALLYRVWSEFGDPRVPAQLQGTPTEDEASLVQAYWSRASLPAAVAGGVGAYLDRPDQAPYGSPDVQLAAAGGPCSNGWTSAAGQNAFRVWATCTGDEAADIGAVAAAMDSLWGPMTAVMGPPLPDDGTGGDTRLDIYLVDDGTQCVTGRDPCYRLLAGEGGRTVPAAPDDGIRTSAFIVLPRALAKVTPAITSLLAHEFFHALQFAHNARGVFAGRASYWFVEASADWAQTAFARPTAASYVYGPQFVDRFQSMDVPLNSDNLSATGDGYRAFIWPYFMQQEGGGNPAIVGAAWKALENAPDFTAADVRLNAVFPFDQHFADFAFRNLNRAFLPTDPIVPRYSAMDPTFPYDASPSAARLHGTQVVSAQPAGQPGLSLPESLDRLTSHYWVFVVPPEVRQIDIDLSGLSGGDLVADAAVLAGHGVPFSGTWERRRLGPGRTTWCRDDPGNDISLAFLVLSNAAFAGSPVTGSLRIVGRAACADAAGTTSWTKTWQIRDPETGAVLTAHATITVYAQFLYQKRSRTWVDQGSSWTVSGNVGLPDTVRGRVGGTCGVTGRAIDFDAGGTFARAGPIPGSTIALATDAAGRGRLNTVIRAVQRRAQTVSGGDLCSAGTSIMVSAVTWAPQCGSLRALLAPRTSGPTRMLALACGKASGERPPMSAPAGPSSRVL